VALQRVGELIQLVQRPADVVFVVVDQPTQLMGQPPGAIPAAG